MQPELQELESWMQDHDWFWSVNSDPRVREHGRLQRDRIWARCEQLKNSGFEVEVYRLWRKWCPFDDLK